MASVVEKGQIDTLHEAHKKVQGVINPDNDRDTLMGWYADWATRYDTVSNILILSN